jgi:NADH-quinone oxidoreductase subunit L
VENVLVSLALMTVLLPLFGAIIAGLLGKKLGHLLTHRIVISLVAIAFFISLYLFKVIVIDAYPAIDHVFYTWVKPDIFQFDVAFLIDRLSATMMTVVLFVSLMVHIYTIGYMADDPGYQRFFSYVSLFTFSMLVLVIADNFLLLFFGWEGVGLVSYLLIGFWFHREPAVFGSLKAFLANRVGDMGFVLAIAAILYATGSLNYHDVFSRTQMILDKTIEIFPGFSFSAISVICFLLFVGAMAKSAQVPLHVWLPESMEGPTPISALIHAATMVTAGIYMIARMSPLFEYSESVLSLILVIGGTTAFFTGLIAVTQYDIKRVIAYSTISQLGYMAVALGASSYNVAIFHLITHAFFKALLFLAAGSVIIALHHEQDMRKMGGLAKYLPITYLTFIVGALALSAIPPFAGFYSKDMVIESAKLSQIPGAYYAYLCVLAGAFITPLYIFRAIFLTFHLQDHTDPELKGHITEPSWVVWVPLLLLAVPSFISGQLLIDPMLFSANKLLGNSIFVLPQHNVLHHIAEEYKGVYMMALSAGQHLTLWLALAGIVTAWLFCAFPILAEKAKQYFAWIYFILVRKFGFDDFNQIVLVHGTRNAGELCYEVSDVKTIDGAVNTSGRMVRWTAFITRGLQTGYIYHYALAMVLGIVIFLAWYLRGF